MALRVYVSGQLSGHGSWRLLDSRLRVAGFRLQELQFKVWGSSGVQGSWAAALECKCLSEFGIGLLAPSVLELLALPRRVREVTRMQYSTAEVSAPGTWPETPAFGLPGSLTAIFCILLGSRQPS